MKNDCIKCAWLEEKCSNCREEERNMLMSSIATLEAEVNRLVKENESLRESLDAVTTILCGFRLDPGEKAIYNKAMEVKSCSGKKK